jgi:hypothetical protein
MIKIIKPFFNVKYFYLDFFKNLIINFFNSKKVMPFNINNCKLIIAGVMQDGESSGDYTISMQASIKTIRPTTWQGNANYSPAPIEYDVIYTVRYNGLSKKVQSKWYIKHNSHQSRVIKVENIDKDDKYIRFYCKTEK